MQLNNEYEYDDIEISDVGGVYAYFISKNKIIEPIEIVKLCFAKLDDEDKECVIREIGAFVKKNKQLPYGFYFENLKNAEFPCFRKIINDETFIQPFLPYGKSKKKPKTFFEFSNSQVDLKNNFKIKIRELQSSLMDDRDKAFNNFKKNYEEKINKLSDLESKYI